jgi:hypothetical protein
MPYMPCRRFFPLLLPPSALLAAAYSTVTHLHLPLERGSDAYLLLLKSKVLLGCVGLSLPFFFFVTLYISPFISSSSSRRRRGERGERSALLRSAMSSSHVLKLFYFLSL